MGGLGVMGAAAIAAGAIAVAAAGVVTAGCESGAGETDVLHPRDAGPDAEYPVNLDGGGEPAVPPDGVAACPNPNGLCNYQSGDGNCPIDAPSCIPASDGNGGITPVCSPAGAGKNGEPCAQITDCVAGYVCAEGACHKLCCGGDWTGCPSADEHCIKKLSYGDGMGGVLPTGAMLCYPVNDCDALVPSGCPNAGETCQIVDATGATACFPEGAGGAGDPCPCKGGFTCVVTEDGSVCRRLCKAVVGGGDPYCPPGEGICTHFTRDPPGVGECVE
jgi:hypothetical protein